MSKLSSSVLLVLTTCAIVVSVSSVSINNRSSDRDQDVEYCQMPLGMEDGRITAEQISATTSHEPSSVGPNSARLNIDTLGGAWCPKGLIGPETYEYVEIDLLFVHRLTEVWTQGRFGNGHGQEYAEAFLIEYWRPGMRNFTRFVDKSGKTILDGNSNTYSVVKTPLDSPIIASKVRIIPYASHRRTVCMRVELVGCRFRDGITSYSLNKPYQDSSVHLADDSYDGVEMRGVLSQGLGQLVDGVTKISSDDQLQNQNLLGGYEWVGWKNESLKPVNLEFFFDQPRQIQTVTLFTSTPLMDSNFGSLAKVSLECSRDVVYEFTNQDPQAEEISLRPADEHCIAKDSIVMRISFEGKWMALTEVSVDSVPLGEDYVPKPIKVFTSSTTSTTATIAHTVPSESPDDVRNKHIDQFWTSGYLGVAIGILVTVIALLLIVVLVVVHRERRAKSGVRRYTSVGNVSSNSQTFFTTSQSVKKHFYPVDENTIVDTNNGNPIYSEPIFTTKNSTMPSVSHRHYNYNNNNGLYGYSDNYAEYSSPLLVFQQPQQQHYVLNTTNATSPASVHRTLLMTSSPSSSSSSASPASPPKWSKFGTALSPQTRANHHKSEAFIVPCYASTDICKGISDN